MALNNFLSEIKQLSDNEALNKLTNLSETEIETYLYLLSTGAITASALSEQCGKPRSSLQANLKKLISSGLVSKTNRNNRTLYIPQHPKKLEILSMQRKIDLEAEIETIEQGKKIINGFIDSILHTIPKASESSKVLVSYYEGETGFKEICQRSIFSSKKEVLFLSNLAEWRKAYSKEYGKKYYVPERKKNNIYLRALGVDNKEGREMKKEDNVSFRETRFLPKEYNLIQPTIIICEDEVSYMLSSKPYKAILIQDKSLTDVWRIIFEKLWNETN
ncbi:MAG: helix-turn-helix domain-containing protein [bacterium]